MCAGFDRFAHVVLLVYGLFLRTPTRCRAAGQKFPQDVGASTVFHPRSQVEDLATPSLRGEAELRGEGRDCLEPVRRRGGRSKQRAELIGGEARVFGDATHRQRVDRMVARDDETGLAVRHDDVAALPGDAVAESLEDADGVALADAREPGHRARR